MRVAFLLLWVSRLAFGQAEFDVHRVGEQYEGQFTRQAQSWQKLKTEITAQLKPNTKLYQLPGFASGEKALSSMPWNYWRERCDYGKKALQGRLLYQDSKVSALQLDQAPDFCGTYFNDGEADRRVVFVRNEDVAGTIPRGEDVTEAVLPDPNCPSCHEDPATAALREMTKAALKPPVKNACKSEAELEEYIKCHSTKDQADYDKYYRKLFNLAGRTFQAAYWPNVGVEPILNSDEVQKRGGELPFLVGARASVMKCIGLRESMWNPKSLSPSGAMGLGQQTEVNVAQIRCLLKGICVEEGSDQPVKRKPTTWAVQLWKEYFQRAKAELTPQEWKALNINPVTHRPCRPTMEDKERDAPCPINSIAAMAINQMEAELTIRRTSDKYKHSASTDFNNEERCDLQVVQGATNNAGTGSLRKAVRAGVKPDQWRGQLKNTTTTDARAREIEEYSKYILNCLQAGNKKSMHPPSPGKNPEDCTPK